MGILGEQSILTQVGGYINENYMFEEYSFQPVGDDYDVDTNVSFKVFNSGNQIASVKIVKIDGEPVNAVNDTYGYDEVYADVTLELEGKEDEYDTEAVKKWILGKLSTMGFDVNPAKVDGDDYNVADYKDEVDDEIDSVRGDVEDIDGEDSFSLSDIEDDEEETEEE